MEPDFLQTHKLVNITSSLAISLHAYHRRESGGSLDHFEYIKDGK
jgi:hypothetical protein